MHPRPSPIAGSMYTLRDLNADVIIMHGPHGCCFRTGRLLENDGVRVLTTSMSENDFIFGASQKLIGLLQKTEEMFQPKLIGVVGTCASMIIGEDLKDAIEQAQISAKTLAIDTHGGAGEGDNTVGAILVLEAATEAGLITSQEAERQIKMLKEATNIEKTRGMAQGEYIKPSYGDIKEQVAQKLLKYLKEDKKVIFVLNAKKETSYLFADFINTPYHKINKNNKPIIIANLDKNIGLPRIKQHAENITQELENNNIQINHITGGLDEYPITAAKAEEYIKKENPDLVVVAGVPHSLHIENINAESIAITDGPRLATPLKELGYDHVVVELDAHAKTLGTNKIVESDFGLILRTLIEKQERD